MCPPKFRLADVYYYTTDFLIFAGALLSSFCTLPVKTSNQIVCFNRLITFTTDFFALTTVAVYNLASIPDQKPTTESLIYVGHPSKASFTLGKHIGISNGSLAPSATCESPVPLSPPNPPPPHLDQPGRWDRKYILVIIGIFFWCNIGSFAAST